MKTQVVRLLPFTLACALATISAAAQSPCSGLDGALAPRIEALVATADYIMALPDSARARYRSFRGLIIEENRVSEHYPLLPYLFFDAGSAELPARYMLLTHPDSTASFVDSTVAGGTLKKQYNLLNIIGARMRLHPAATIEVVGFNSDEPALGESRELSRQRGEFVREYLRNIWNIDERRIRLLAPRDRPEHVSEERSSTSLEESRRVEIRSSDWEILRPVSHTEVRRYAQPDELRFRARTGIARDRIASSTIEITRYGEPWHTIHLAAADSITGPYDWSRNGDQLTVPTDEAPYRARLVVRLTDGTECVSQTIEVPVLIITSERKRVERLIDREIDRFTVLLFPYGLATGGDLERRVIREMIAPTIRRRAQIQIDGHANAEPSAEALAQVRAAWVEEMLGQIIPNDRSGTVALRATGSAYPLYRIDRPEGRCYNRTVQVIITTPIGD